MFILFLHFRAFITYFISHTSRYAEKLTGRSLLFYCAEKTSR